MRNCCHNAVAVLAVLVAADWAAAEVPTTGPTPAEVTRKRLEQISPAFTADPMPVDELLRAFQTDWGIAFDIDWPTIEQAAIAKSTPVTLKQRNAPRKRILNLVLDKWSNSSGDSSLGRLGAVVQPDGRVLITTYQKIIPRFATTRRFLMRDTVGPASRPDMWMGSVEEYAKHLADTKESIRSLIIDTIADGSWARVPGDFGGTAVFENDTLIVTHSPEVQEEVALLLWKLGSSSTATQPAK